MTKQTRDSQGRFWSNKRLIRYILLTIAAAVLAFTLYRLDIMNKPASDEMINPLIETVSAQEKSISEIIRDRENQTVTAIIAERFGEYADQAIKVAFCESRLNRLAVSHTSDYGVFQINKQTWFRKYLLDDESALQASDNTAVAYDIFKNNGYSWRAWYSSYKCHGLK